MNFWTLFLEIWYIYIGLIFIVSGVDAFKNVDDNRKYGASLFWFILAFLFMVGPYVPKEVNGFLVLGLGVLSAFKVVNISKIEMIPDRFRQTASDRIGLAIFIPSLIIALGAVIFSMVLPGLADPALKVSDSVFGYIAIGLSAFCGLIAALIITKAGPQDAVKDASRLMRTMGSFSILPQLLAGLGAIFTSAGVGQLISTLMSNVIPNGSALAGVIAYCVGMAIFTIIMGNAFAAFAVITVGIGIPFVFSQGADPVIAGALAMTAGFCGTLLTPMAANFNLLPATLLETKSQYTVIKYQAPFAIALLIAHIVLMYFLAF